VLCAQMEGIRSVARKLSKLVGTLKQWVSAKRQVKFEEIGKAQNPMNKLELFRLKKELVERKMERDF